MPATVPSGLNTCQSPIRKSNGLYSGASQGGAAYAVAADVMDRASSHVCRVRILNLRWLLRLYREARATVYQFEPARKVLQNDTNKIDIRLMRR